MSNIEDHLVKFLVFPRRPHILIVQAASVEFLSFRIVSLTWLRISRSYSIILPIARLKRWLTQSTSGTSQMSEMTLFELQLFVIIQMKFSHFTL